MYVLFKISLEIWDKKTGREERSEVYIVFFIILGGTIFVSAFLRLRNK